MEQDGSGIFLDIGSHAYLMKKNFLADEKTSADVGLPNLKHSKTRSGRI